jgi:hypothetical protein
MQKPIMMMEAAIEISAAPPNPGAHRHGNERDRYNRGSADQQWVRPRRGNSGAVSIEEMNAETANPSVTTSPDHRQ